MTKTTIDEAEVKKFSDMADEWWDENGKFKPLHKFNPIRIAYIRHKLESHFKLEEKTLDLFKNIEIIDIGCGGGLIAEPLARMGGNVTAIDASEKNIKIAKIHAEKSSLKINYINTSAEEFAKENKKFDVVLALEIIEHVSDVEEFVRNLELLLKPGGLLFIATINRTPKSFLFAKIAVEYILRWLPINTHSWKKFLKPHEINSYAEKYGLKLDQLCGFTYNIFKDEFKTSETDLDVNYIAVFKKN